MLDFAELGVGTTIRNIYFISPLRKGEFMISTIINTIIAFCQNNLFDVANAFVNIINLMKNRNNKKELAKQKNEIETKYKAILQNSDLLSKIDYALNTLDNESIPLKRAIALYITNPVQMFLYTTKNTKAKADLSIFLNDISKYSCGEGYLTDKNEKDVRNYCIINLNKIKSTLDLKED